MIVGISAVMAVWGECIYLFNERESLLKFKRTYPQVGVILTIVCASYAIYTINSVLFVSFGILLSICGKFLFYTISKKKFFFYRVLKLIIRIQN